MVHPMGPSKIGLKVQGVTFNGNIIFSPILTELQSFLSHLTICSLYNFLTFFSKIISKIPYFNICKDYSGRRLYP